MSIFYFVIAQIQWIFDGFGVPVVVWLYRKFSRAPSNVPQSISVPDPIERRLLPSKKAEEIALEQHSEVTDMIKRFNIVLSLMNQRRTYQKYTIAKLAQILQLHSIGELESVFLGKREPSFEFIDNFCRCFGIYKEWLVNREITPYYNDGRKHLMPLAYFDEIKLSKPEQIFFIRCKSPVGETFIVLKFSDWKYKILSYLWHISDHVGGTGESQIFSMYCLIRALENEGRYCSGRILDNEDFRQLRSGNIFPWGVLEAPNCHENYWCHDFLDVYSTNIIATTYESNYGQPFYESTYGKGFAFAQSVVRYELEDHDKRKAANPSIHSGCTICLALSSPANSRIV
jgi:hypothetical protein